MRNTYTQTYAHHTRARAAIAHTHTNKNQHFLEKIRNIRLLPKENRKGENQRHENAQLKMKRGREHGNNNEAVGMIGHDDEENNNTIINEWGIERADSMRLRDMSQRKSVVIVQKHK